MSLEQGVVFTLEICSCSVRRCSGLHVKKICVKELISYVYMFNFLRIFYINNVIRRFLIAQKICSSFFPSLSNIILKVHKIENFFDSDFGICVISLLVMHK